jgi:hypothetical protein
MPRFSCRTETRALSLFRQANTVRRLQATRHPEARWLRASELVLELHPESFVLAYGDD